MSKVSEISQSLIDEGLDLIGDVVPDVSKEQQFYAFIRVSLSKDGAQNPTNYQLRQLSEKFETRETSISFILVNNEIEDVQASIKASLFRFFPDEIRNAFTSFERNKATVWIEPKKVLNQEEEIAITEKVRELLSVLAIKLEAVRVTSTENVPTKTACLKMVRLHAPLTLEALEERLHQKGFHVPNSDWLARILDTLRKSQKLQRNKEGYFALTLSGLKSLGTEKNRRSPDIARALEISTRRS